MAQESDYSFVCTLHFPAGSAVHKGDLVLPVGESWEGGNPTPAGGGKHRNGVTRKETARRSRMGSTSNVTLGWETADIRAYKTEINAANDSVEFTATRTWYDETGAALAIQDTVKGVWGGMEWGNYDLANPDNTSMSSVECECHEA